MMLWWAGRKVLCFIWAIKFCIVLWSVFAVMFYNVATLAITWESVKYQEVRLFWWRIETSVGEVRLMMLQSVMAELETQGDKNFAGPYLWWSGWGETLIDSLIVHDNFLKLCPLIIIWTPARCNHQDFILRFIIFSIWCLFIFFCGNFYPFTSPNLILAHYYLRPTDGQLHPSCSCWCKPLTIKLKLHAMSQGLEFRNFDISYIQTGSTHAIILRDVMSGLTLLNQFILKASKFGYCEVLKALRCHYRFHRALSSIIENNDTIGNGGISEEH